MVAYISRSDTDLVLANGPFANGVINLWALTAIVFLLLGLYLPVLNGVLRLTPLPAASLLTALAVVVVLLLEVQKALMRPKRPDQA